MATKAATAAKPTKKQLMELEHQYWQALKERDIDAAMRLTDNPCIVTGAQGVTSVNKEQFKSMMQQNSWQLEDFSFDDVQVQVLNDDVAIVAYKVREQLTVEGTPLTLDAADASTWRRRGSKWLCALHTESVAGDPFGRDRQAS
jgi:ketosteroid isomerase-like protein